MRELNRNERLLAISLGTLVFLLINLFGIRWVAQRIKIEQQAIAQIQLQLSNTRQALAEKPMWMAREAWMDAHPMQTYDERKSRSEFVQQAQAGVKKHELKILAQQPQETEHLGRLAVTKIDFSLQGRLENIVKWMLSVQQPGNYQAIQKMTLKQSDDGNTMQAEDLRFAKVFQTGPPAASP